MSIAVQKIKDLFMNILFMTKKADVWCVINAHRITGPIFHDDTVG
jgi:hypothetical protein